MQRAAFEAQIGVDAELEEPDPPVARRLGEIGVPALVIVGADDVEDFVRLGERLAGELPGAGPLVRIAGAAHLPALERPDEVAAVVRAVPQSSMCEPMTIVRSSGRPKYGDRVGGVARDRRNSLLRHRAIPGASVGTIVMREMK